MGWSQTGRVLLAWPARGRILTRRLDLVLLLRHSAVLGVQMALICQDKEVLDHARSLGISVFDSIRQAQEARWKRPKQKRLFSPDNLQRKPEQLSRSSLAAFRHADRISPQLSGYWRIILFSLGVLAVLAIASVLFPGAEISLQPRTERQVITFVVQASRSAQRVNLAGIVPLRSITRVVEGRASLPATGRVLLPDNPAQGEVVFTNLTDQPVTIPSGTVVATGDDTIRFATQREGRVPAGPGTSTTIPIRAVSPGRASNLPAGSIRAIEGDLGIALAVSNLKPTTGGTDTLTPAPSDADQAELRSQLMVSLSQTALQEMRTALAIEDILASSSTKLVNVLEEDYTPLPGEPGNELTLTLRAEFQVDFIARSDIIELAAGILDANLPKDATPASKEVGIEQITRIPTTEDGETHWRVQASRTIQYEPQGSSVVSLSLGLTPARARQHLKETFSLPEEPHITLSPSWWPMMPILPFRISVTIPDMSS